MHLGYTETYDRLWHYSFSKTLFVRNLGRCCCCLSVVFFHVNLETMTSSDFKATSDWSTSWIYSKVHIKMFPKKMKKMCSTHFTVWFCSLFLSLARETVCTSSKTIWMLQAKTINSKFEPSKVIFRCHRFLYILHNTIAICFKPQWACVFFSSN